ncbi:MAG TPA: STAS domain-containing protein [Noviherbaspirillum sp.]|nr:STAS domain-containing protein [Noviherbaspirillum sp.]
MFRPPLTLTVNNAGLALEAGLRAIEEGQTEIDLGELAAVDSAAVATLLAWQRAARARGAALRFANVPANLLGLAALYGVDELLRPVP